MLHFLLPDQGSGFCVTGKIEAGYIQTGDKILAMPPNESCTVKGMHWCNVFFIDSNIKTPKCFLSRVLND